MTLVEVDAAPEIPATLLTISPTQSEITDLDIGQTFTVTLAAITPAPVTFGRRGNKRP